MCVLKQNTAGCTFFQGVQCEAIHRLALHGGYHNLMKIAQCTAVISLLPTTIHQPVCCNAAAGVNRPLNQILHKIKFLFFYLGGAHVNPLY